MIPFSGRTSYPEGNAWLREGAAAVREIEGPARGAVIRAERAPRQPSRRSTASR